MTVKTLCSGLTPVSWDVPSADSRFPGCTLCGSIAHTFIGTLGSREYPHLPNPYSLLLT
ncbi:MAG: hypothetical protein WC542_10475 [Paludibacter sp.]